QLLRLPAPQYFSSVDTGLRTYKARHHLGSIYLEQNRWPEAEENWRSVVAERPGFGPAWSGLGGLALKQRPWPDPAEGGRRLRALPGETLSAADLEARGGLARKDFQAARALLEAVIQQYPDVVGLRVLLSYAFLQEGRDWDAAEKALRDVLALDPNDAEA